MKLHSIRRHIEHVTEAGHGVTLALVAIAASATLLQSAMPGAGEFERLVNDALHWVHWGALALAVAYGSCSVMFGRNAAREISSSIEKPTDSPFISLFPQEVRYRYQSLDVTARDVAFVTSANGDDWNELLRLNEEGFDGTAFELDHGKLARRNKQWVEKNDRLFMLVTSGARGDGPETTHVGYTSVVPLTDTGADVYFRGLIKDQDLPASLICRPGEPTQALLIFAVAVDRRWRRLLSLGRPQLNRLLKALEYHVQVVAAAHAGHPKGLLLWTQTEHKSIASHLEARGFAPTVPPTVSADGFELVSLPLAAPVSGAAAAVQ
jgi:hypothetical protein